MTSKKINSKPLITVVTVVYNDSNNIGRTIYSVLSQQHIDLEYIVIDGCSTDGTMEVVTKYKDRIRKLISEKDSGIYDAMNKSLDLANGRWVLFLNSGDILAGTYVLSKLQNYLEFDVDILYGDVWIDRSGDRKKRKGRGVNELWKGLPFSHQSAVVRTDLLRSIKFNTKWNIAADYNFFCECASRKVKFKYIDLPISIVTSGGKSDKERVNALNQILSIARDKKFGLKSEFYIGYRKFVEAAKWALRRYLK